MQQAKERLTALLFSFFSLFAQMDTLRLSLEEVWERALDKNLKRKSQLLDGQLAEKQLSAVWAQLYPQINALMDVRYNIERPIFLLPGETVDRPDEVVLAKLGSDNLFTEILEP